MPPVMQSLDRAQSAALPASRAPRKPELDGLRGIAILLVLIFHCRAIANPVTMPQRLYYSGPDAGWIGVDIFFVLSGFLITNVLLNTTAHAGYYSHFYIRRALRIFPLYYVIIALLALGSLLGFFQIDPSFPGRQIWYWFYVQNWLIFFRHLPIEVVGHFWSLAVEEQFYLVWPLLILLASRRRLTGSLCVLTIGVSFAIRIGMVLAGVIGVYFYTIARMDTLAFGALAAVLMHRFDSLPILHRPALAASLASGALVTVIAVRQRGFYGHDPVILIFGLLPLAVFFASLLVLAFTCSPSSLWRRLLRNRLLRFIGTISYGIYVFH
jgi:peptidoglycan/LPS O-acetylase OafA/YrhL